MNKQVIQGKTTDHENSNKQRRQPTNSNWNRRYKHTSRQAKQDNKGD